MHSNIKLSVSSNSAITNKVFFLAKNSLVDFDFGKYINEAKICELLASEFKKDSQTINTKVINFLNKDGNLESVTVVVYEASQYQFKKAVSSLIKLVEEYKINKFILNTPDLAENYLVQLLLALDLSNYVYSHSTRAKNLDAIKNKFTIEEIVLAQAKVDDKLFKRISLETKAIVAAKDFINIPANHCTPTFLSQKIEKTLTGLEKVKVKILNEADLLKEGMGAILAVSQGSKEQGFLVVAEYKGNPKSDDSLALVGKGVTFDTGGISIKPASGMDRMKYDMGGAASCFGAFYAAALMQLPINLTLVIPTVENMPSSTAVKPGDVITSMSGQTIEVLNTDAEGRLILCDALTYVQKYYNPSKIIDIATLTGACVVALGHHAAAILGNNDEFISDLIGASQTANDAMWQLPLGQEWDEQLKSNFADMANIGTPGAGTITAACFLQRFIENNTDWAHLDIAGVTWSQGSNASATGRPIFALVEYLISASNKN